VPRFVVQQHAARTLHYDFRLQVGRVMKSWAVPKGLSTDPDDKRLAVEVEDHSLGYADFEGRIGGGYGKGRVIVWDRGTWRAITKGSVKRALADGHLSFWLDGEKLCGGWTLQRTHAGAKPKWLLIKRRDDGVGRPLPPHSVLSGRTIEEL
jgi:DNA ligase D-like protein (predicted 3'-phosphoesterase)